MKETTRPSWMIFYEKVMANGKGKPRLLSEIETPNGRKFGFFFGGKEVCIYAADYPNPYAISGYDFSAPLRLAPILEHLRTTFKIDPMDEAFGWLIVCSQGVQKMMKKEKRKKKS